MKFTKMLAVCAVTITAIAAMAMSASAATIGAEYVAPDGDQTGKIRITSELTPATGDHTLLVLNRDVFGDFTEGEEGTVTVSADDIVQIDQAATFDTVVVGDLAADIDAANQTLLNNYAAIEDPTPEDYDSAFATWKASQTYYVRVGGGSTIDVAQITANTTKVNNNVRPEEVPDEPQPGDDDYPYLKGDINKDGWIGIDDVEIMLMYEAGDLDYDSASEEEQFLGDCTDDQWIGIDDVQEALIVEAGDESDYIVQYE